MNEEIRKIEPQKVWNNFTNLNAIPRPSGQVQEAREFLLNFGQSLGLKTIEDSTGNVIIKKPATAGMENRKTVVLQGHFDMVAQKNSDVEHDFKTEGIKMVIDGDWVRAKGTTLGADNGLGVAAIMAVLESDDLKHPALEALFTYDEETGMDGAINLDHDVLEGDILLNLDTEEDDEIDIGCAGGVDVTGIKSYTAEDLKDNMAGFSLKISGLQGGHSGMDIHKGFGNANKLINRVLYAVLQKTDLQIAEIDGGGLRNAIPRESALQFITDFSDVKVVKEAVREEIKAIKEEYKAIEPQIKFGFEQQELLPAKVLSVLDSKVLIQTVYAIPNGVYRMSPDIEDLVETSNNLARVAVKDGKIQLMCLTRSSVDSGKWDLVNQLRSIFALGGFKVTTEADYPGWQPNPDSAILKVLEKTYIDQNGTEPDVVACHAGLECGILLSHYPNLDAISFGPTIRGAHSPDERAGIKSTQKFWRLLVEVLENIPVK